MSPYNDEAGNRSAKRVAATGRACADGRKPDRRLTLGPGWTDSVRLLCQDRCAETGDFACYDLAGENRYGEGPTELTPCDACKKDLPPI